MVSASTEGTTSHYLGTGTYTPPAPALSACIGGHLGILIDDVSNSMIAMFENSKLNTS